MPAPSVVVFDVNETLSDMSVLGSRFVDVGASASLAPLWFASVLRDGFALTAAGGTARFVDIAREVLGALLTESGSAGDVESAVAHVLDGFSSLELHPDVLPAVRGLREKGLRLVTLSNGSAQIAQGLLAGAGVREEFEHLLSVEDAGRWKPAPEPYRFAAERCGVDLGEMLMVAVHPWDLDGAARAGMQTAWVNREERAYPAYATAPTYTVASLEELAGVLAG